jgi:glycine/D-amino acid oxidase-like deaminating enzyme
MDLKSGYPFWPIKNGLIASYPALKQDLTCDVAVIGGGITGALIAYYLTEAGCDTVVVDRRDIGSGSTSASTGLLQYEVDRPLFQLIDMVGREHAVRSYLLCLEAIGKLARLIGELDDDCGFEQKHSLYLASRRRHVGDLRKEYQARRACGIRLDYLDQAEIASRYSFSYPAALFSYDAAQVDAYRLTHALLRAATRHGLRVYDRTAVTDYVHTDAGMLLTTDRGCRIAARKVAFAAGFEAHQYLRRKIVSFKSTYALISEPLEHFEGWPDQCLIWESARPYVYMRTTNDGRVIIGGEDDMFDSEARRERRLDRKRDKLVKRFRELFPAIDLEVAYYWAGTFGETADGLAYIGETPECPNGYFALGYGGNGITYRLIAAEINSDIYTGRPNRDAEIFRFDR